MIRYKLIHSIPIALAFTVCAGALWLSRSRATGDSLTLSSPSGHNRLQADLGDFPISGSVAEGAASHEPIDLRSGEYLGLEVDQIGIDLYVLVRDPDGNGVARFDNPHHHFQPEKVEIVAERSGDYRLEIGSVYQGRRAGQYRIRALERRPATSQDRHRALALLARLEATPWMRRGAAQDLPRALAKLEESLKQERLAGNLEGQALVRHWLARVHNSMGNSLAALGDARASIDLWRRAGDWRHEVLTHGVVASTYHRLGEPQKVLDSFSWAYARSEEASDLLSQADALLWLGMAQARQGEPAEAEAHLSRALKAWRAYDHPFRELSVLVELGGVKAALGDSVAALEHYQEALELSREVPHYPSDLGLLERSGRTHLALGQLDQAERYADRLLEEAAREGNAHRETGALLLRGKVLEALGEPERALSYYRESLARSSSVGDLRGDVLFAIARLKLTQGHLRDSLEVIVDGVEHLESRSLRHGDREFAARIRAPRRHLHELHLQVLMQLHELEPSAGWDEEAFLAHERARALSLLGALSETRVVMNRMTGTDLLAWEQQLLEGLRDSRDAPEPGSSQPQSPLVQRLARYQEIQAQLRARSSISDSTRELPTLPLRDVQREVLDRETLLLQYVLAEPRSFLFALSADDLFVFGLPGRIEIEQKVGRLHRLLRAREQRLDSETSEEQAERVARADIEAEHLGHQVSRDLLGPVADLLDSQRLLIAGEGSLQFLPWAALPRPVASEPSGEVGRPVPLLIRHHELVQAPSASVVAALRRRHAPRLHDTTLAVVADPDLRAAAPDRSESLFQWLGRHQRNASRVDEALWSGPLLRSLSDTELEAFAPLPGARTEADAILDLVPREERLPALGSRADRDRILRGLLSDSRIVHFATHGVLNSRHPDLSGLVLSLVNADGTPRDGFLRLFDIYRLELSAELVVLSACQTALGREVRGEGVDGLVRGFLSAGASSVVASSWNVDDWSTAELMERFYRGMLLEGLPAAAALRQAQLSMAEEERWSAPYYWAGFTTHGDWRAPRSE